MTAKRKDPCPVCEGEGVVLAGASIHSTQRPDLVTCADCGGTGEKPQLRESWG